jgi:large subunit ribosomal protein L28e
MAVRKELLFPHQDVQHQARNLFHHKGPIHHKMVGVEPPADSKGVMVVMKRRSGQRKPATSYVKATINKNAWATLSSVRHMIRRASTIQCGQRPVVVKRKHTG